jgi:hypothetical protein
VHRAAKSRQLLEIVDARASPMQMIAAVRQATETRYVRSYAATGTWRAVRGSSREAGTESVGRVREADGSVRTDEAELVACWIQEHASCPLACLGP